MGSIAAKVKKELSSVIVWHLIVIMGLALILLLLKGLQSSLSVFLGGLAYWLPTSFFLWRLSAHSGARAAKRFVFSFFTGEALKLFFCGALFIVFVKYLSINLFAALFGLVGAIVAFWIVSFILVFQSGVKS